MAFRSAESRIVRNGWVGLAAVAAVFAVTKVALWSSVVVHEERTSIHRRFPGGLVVRFPQEAFNLADFLTGTFLILAGACAAAIAFAMSERIRTRRTASIRDAFRVRAFMRLAAFGFVWLGIDEVFLVHELLSANLYVHDALFLALYGGAGFLAAIWYQRVLRASGWALGVLAMGAMFHGAALGMDFAQEWLGWVPEEPFEMIAAGFYAIGLATYAVRFLSAFATETARADLGASTNALAATHYYSPAASGTWFVPRPERPRIHPAPEPPADAPTPLPQDPAWTH